MEDAIPNIQIWDKAIQGGFAVFALAMLSSLLWIVMLLRRAYKENSEARDKHNEAMVVLVKENMTVVCNNTEAIHTLARLTEETRQLQIELKSALLSKPCLFDPETRAELREIVREKLIAGTAAKE